jgi:hypothetical protein
LRTDWIISACCHALAMGAALVSFTAPQLPIPRTESIAVNIVSDIDTSQMTAGLPSAPKQVTPTPFAERIGEPNSVSNPAAKIAPREITASTDTPSPPPPEPKQAAKKKSEPQRDLIADALKKDDAKKTEQKQADAKIPTPPKRPPPPQPQTQPQPKHDPRQVAALLDKRDPRRNEATNSTMSDIPSLGATRGAAAKLSQSEEEALIARMIKLWNPPAGVREEIIVKIRIRLRPDGTLADWPLVLTSGRTQLFMVSRERAINAVRQGAPFDMLRPENYETWKEIEITFDPRLIGG